MGKMVYRFAVSMACANASLFMIVRALGKDTSFGVAMCLVSAAAYAVFTVTVMMRGVE